jgi:hypothetical protein
VRNRHDADVSHDDADADVSHAAPHSFLLAAPICSPDEFRRAAGMETMEAPTVSALMPGVNSRFQG